MKHDEEIGDGYQSGFAGRVGQGWGFGVAHGWWANDGSWIGRGSLNGKPVLSSWKHSWKDNYGKVRIYCNAVIL